MVTINSTVPAQMTVCGADQTFTVDIYNPSPFIITNDTLKITMPMGIYYTPSSVTGAGDLGYAPFPAPPNTILFLLSSIPTLTSLHITFRASAQCVVLYFIAGGGITKNSMRVNYTAFNPYTNTPVGNFYNTSNTSTYLIRSPYLTISSVTNQTFVGSIGGTFTRCITIVNGGFGELSTFTFTDIHASGIQIVSVDHGVLTYIGATAKVVLGAADFTTVGNHNNLFESGESITICETVHINDCISGTSNLKAFWGCGVNSCQSSISTANVVFPNYVPNLQFTPDNGTIYSPMNSCIGGGNASPQVLKIVNTGLGQATNVQLDIFQATGTGYNCNVGSSMDVASLTMQHGIGGATTPLTPTSTQAACGHALTCLAGAKGRMQLNIPTINSGDTIYIRWNTYSCCYNACTNTGQSYINGWRYKGSYQSICQNNYVIYENWGRVYSNIYGALTPDGSPSTLNNGQTGHFNFLFSNYGNSYTAGPGAYWKFDFTLPPLSCLTYSNIHILSYDGVTVWSPTSITPSGNIVSAVFNGSPPFNLNQGELMIDLTLNCGLCNGIDSLTAVSVKSYYVPNNTCGCQIGISCQSEAFNVNCPSPCPVGLFFNNFDMSRTSYGKPDNEPGGGNGIPDGAGSLNFAKIKTNRAMFGDTITTKFTGITNLDIGHPSLPYLYAVSTISNGSVLSFLDAKLFIYRGGSLFATCTNITPSISTMGADRIFSYDISDSALIFNGCVTAGFDFATFDSLILMPRYKVTTNIGNVTPLNCSSTHQFYLADMAHPTLASHKFKCGNYSGNTTVVGYFYHMEEQGSYDTKSCSTVPLSLNYYLSIGPWDNNNAGGNFFPYEYRNWAHIKNLTAEVPYGYTFVSARFNAVRTAGTLVTSNSGWITVTPSNPNSDTLSFPVEQYYQGYGGSIPLSDDGFDGTLEVTIEPSCTVVPEVYENVKNDETFAPTSFLSGPGSDTTYLTRSDDNIVYDAPVLTLQSPLPSILALTNTVTWDVIISNTSNVSNAVNTWLSAPAITGVTITHMIDLTGGATITPVGGIYPVGAVNAMGTRTLRLTGTYTSCSPDSIIVYSGWNCAAGYPANLASYPCPKKRIALTLTPLMPALIVDPTGPTGTIQLCDTASYTAKGLNVQLGTAFHVVLTATLPTGVAIKPGSSMISYPIINPYFHISDPSQSGNICTWDISAADSLIGVNGLLGILDSALNSFNLKFKVTTSCGYVSGSNISFILKGKATCGADAPENICLAPDLNITGIAVPYAAVIKLSTTYVSPCAGYSTMHVAVHNNGPTSFANTDSITVTLPVGVPFVAGSFIGIHNGPVSGVPKVSSLNGNTYLTWKLPAGVVMGDSTVFNFQYIGNPHELGCGIIFFEAKTYSISIVNCISNGLPCVTNVTSADTTLAVFTYKAYLALSNGSAVSVPHPPGGERVTASYDITNTGQAILTDADSIVQFFYDANADGILNAGDVFLAEDTLIIPKDSTVRFTSTFNVPAGMACSIIAFIDPRVNSCVCDSSQLLMHASLASLGRDSIMCSGQTLTLSYPPVTGYTYSWAPGTSLSSTSIANPVLTALNLTAAPVTTTYVLATTRMTCSSTDTIKITVNPIPISIAGTDITTCSSATPGNIGAPSNPGYIYSWSPAAGLSNPAMSNPTVTLASPDTTAYIITSTAYGCSGLDTVIVTINPIPPSHAGADILSCPSSTPGNLGTANHPGYAYSWTPSAGLSDPAISNPTVSLTAPGTTSYIVTTTAPGCISTDTVIVKVNPSPTGVIAGTTELCAGAAAPNITFTGAAGTAPYTFTYKINGGAALTVRTSGGNSITVPVPTTVPGTFIYKMISVQDSSSTVCSSSLNDSVIVIVDPLPSALVSGTTAVCQGGIPPNITFTGAGGTAPYTFTYTINSGANLTVTTTSGNSVTVAAPTTAAGTFIYDLVSIRDASITTCSNAQSGSAAITVNGLPAAAITGTTAVCLFANSPNIIFAGSAGTRPYTFTYTINGGAPLSVTTTIGDSVNVPAPTSAVGTFTYALVSIMDGSSTTCSRPQSGSASIEVDPLPTATIWGTTTVCQYSTAPLVTFVGHGGTAPYTFAYKINNVLQPILVTISGDSVKLPAPSNITGVYTYSLVSVQDANAAACTHPQTGNVIITVNTKPNAAFSCPKVCNTNATQFSDSSTTALGTLSTWAWDFGDGSALNNAQSPSHTYAAGGLHTVTLIVTNSFACTDTMIRTAQVYYNPVVSFTHSNVCLGDTMRFTNTSTVPSPASISGYLWVFGDGSATNNSVNPIHYYSAPNTFNITLVATTADGCSGVINAPVKTFDAPVSAFTLTNTCLFDTAKFINISVNPTIVDASGVISNWSWNFGDGSPLNTSVLSPQHLYHLPGNYPVTLITHSSDLGCPDTVKHTITVFPMPAAKFSFTNVCLNKIMNFNDSSTVSGGNTITNWAWTFGDGGPVITVQNPSYTYQNPGTYGVTLIAKTNNGCKDTVQKSVVVHPLPHINFSAPNACDGTSIQYTNLCTITPTDTIHSYSWNFGDGSPRVPNPNPSHLYAGYGSYPVKLTAVSNFGCVDSITKNSIVNPNPVVKFGASDTVGCEPFCIAFQDLSTNPVDSNVFWQWTFGDLSAVSTSHNPHHCYKNDSVFAPNSFNVTLTVTSDSGCYSLKTKNNYITVYPKPVAAFSAAPKTETIINPVISFKDASTGTNFWNWNFGDSDTSTIHNTPPHTYKDTGTFKITLIASTIYNCTDTAYQSITIEPDFVFYIPNSFSPNDDGINDTFSGKGIFIFDYEMMIFDRWGNLVFYSDDLNKPWDGKANFGKQPAQMDVYVYTIKLTDIYHQAHSYKGTVTIVK